MANPRFSSRQAHWALSLICAAALAACGGGGSDAGTPTTSGDALVITADNANAVVRAGLLGFQVGGLAGGLDASLLASAGSTPLISQARRVLKVDNRRGLATQTLPCEGGGTLSLGLNETNSNNQFDAVGEALTLVAVQCKQADGSSVNGSLSLKITQFTSAHQLGISLSFASFSTTEAATATTPASTTSLDGGLTLTRSSASNFNLHSDSFSLASNHSGTTRSFNVTGYDMTLTDDGTTTTQTLAGTFSGSEFSNRAVTISTPVAVKMLDVDAFPYTGTVLAKGANGSQVKVEAISNTQARISVDATGDGSFETANTVLWTSLQ